LTCRFQAACYCLEILGGCNLSRKCCSCFPDKPCTNLWGARLSHLSKAGDDIFHC
jgi:hypothetical protein